MGNYIERTDITNWPGTLTNAQKEEIIDRVELQIEKYADSFFYEKALDFRLNGNGKNRLFLPLEADIITITGIDICDLAMPESWIDFDKNSVFLNVCGEGIYQSGFSYAEWVYRLGDTEEIGLFPRGHNNIRVQGTYGNTELQAIAKQVCKIIIEEENAPGTYKRRFKSEKIGDYSYNYEGTGAGNIYTGIREADDLIELLVRDTPILTTP